MRQPTVSAAKTKQRYKKRRNCKHKKSGCVCFIVARLRAAPLRNWGIGSNKALCAAADSNAKLRIGAKTRKTIRNKIRTVFPIRTFHQAKRGAKERDFPMIRANKGTFPIFPRTLPGAETICLLPPHLSRAYAPSTVFRYLSSPFTPAYISLKMCPLGVKALHLFAVHSLHSKRVAAIRLQFNDKIASVRWLGMGELRHFSSFTGSFTLIPLIFCNLQRISF